LSNESEITFQNLVERLRFDPSDGNNSATMRVANDSDFYIAPVLNAHELNDDAQVTLLSARGAAGKSRTATQLSFALQAPVWRLELDGTVSRHSLRFVLGSFLGELDPAQHINRAPLVIVDSLDEARSRVSGQSWSEFVESIAEFASAGVHFVLCGRERTLEDTWAAVADLGVSVEWYEISHFAPAQRLAYVDRFVETRDPEVDTSSTVYIEARDAVLGSLTSSLAEHEANVFVGYAPVLDAVATLLTQKPNFIGIKHDFESIGAESRLGVLRAILRKLLQRDQEKIKPLADELGIEPSVAFSPEEQLAWLFAQLEGGPTPGLAHIGDEALQQRYGAQILRWVHEHPFRSEIRWASPVFEAFVASEKFEDEFRPGRLVEIGDASGLLFDFVALERTSATLDEVQFAALHASVAAAQWGEASASVDVERAQDGIFAGRLALSDSDQLIQSLDIEIVPSSEGTLELHGPLSDLTVAIEGRLTVPGGNRSPVLGPDLFLHAQSVEIRGEFVEFARRASGDHGSASGTQVVIEALEKVTLPPQIAVPPAPGDFELRVPGEVTLSYPWVQYREQLDLPQAPPNDRAVRFLNMLMNLTRNHGHSGERAVYIKKLQGRQSVKFGALQSALEVLQTHGVVRLAGDMIYMSSAWEQHRYHGKALAGQRQLDDVYEAWIGVLADLSAAIEQA
jgi:hypothetical protein